MKLSTEQRELLVLFERGPRDGITDRSGVEALKRRGLLACEEGGHRSDDVWSLTDAGRAVLKAETAGDPRPASAPAPR